MSNITHIAEANQVQISQHQLERFVDFINNAEEGFSALETLVRLIMEKSEKHTTAYTLAAITWDKLDDWATVCHEEIGYFKQHSPKSGKLGFKGVCSMNAKMNNSVTVADKVLDIVEYQGQRVVTFAMIDEVHSRPEGTAKRNFGVNKNHLVIGEDYLELGKDEIRSNLQDGVFSKFAATGILITESGYLMLVKSFTDELAWKVQKQLVKGYFKAKELVENFDPMKTLSDPNALRGLLLGYSEKVIELEHKVEVMSQDVNALDRISKADGSFCLTDAAKALQMRPKDFISHLSSEKMKWIYKRAGNSHWLGYSDKVQAGYLEHKVTEVTRGDGTTKITEQVRITPKGLAKLAKDQGGQSEA